MKTIRNVVSVFYLKNGTGKAWAGHNKVALFFKSTLTIRDSSPEVNLGKTLATGSKQIQKFSA